jgi:hypothetical protein
MARSASLIRVRTFMLTTTPTTLEDLLRAEVLGERGKLRQSPAGHYS